MTLLTCVSVGVRPICLISAPPGPLRTATRLLPPPQVHLTAYTPVVRGSAHFGNCDEHLPKNVNVSVVKWVWMETVHNRPGCLLPIGRRYTC